jgi:hypothetical protein
LVWNLYGDGYIVENEARFTRCDVDVATSFVRIRLGFKFWYLDGRKMGR